MEEKTKGRQCTRTRQALRRRDGGKTPDMKKGGQSFGGELLVGQSQKSKGSHQDKQRTEVKKGAPPWRRGGKRSIPMSQRTVVGIQRFQKFQPTSLKQFGKKLAKEQTKKSRRSRLKTRGNERANESSESQKGMLGWPTRKRKSCEPKTAKGPENWCCRGGGNRKAIASPVQGSPGECRTSSHRATFRRPLHNPSKVRFTSKIGKVRNMIVRRSADSSMGSQLVLAVVLEALGAQESSRGGEITKGKTTKAGNSCRVGPGALGNQRKKAHLDQFKGSGKGLWGGACSGGLAFLKGGSEKWGAIEKRTQGGGDEEPPLSQE